MGPQLSENYHCSRSHLSSIPLSRAKISREKGCISCSFILDVVDTYSPGWAVENLDTKSLLVKSETRRIRLLEGKTQVGSFSLHFKSPVPHFYEPCSSKPPSIIEEVFGFSLQVGADSTSRESFDRIRHWYSHCVQHDPQCAVEDPSVMPGRLLRLEADGSAVRLYETGNLADRPQYACLSYCWGPDTTGVLTTTRQNFKDHSEGISVTKLPRTVADAVRVCHELQIPNIWVDSICIVQDDRLDFAVEGSNMDEIYGNSLLTIYAKEAASCKQGFLGRQLHGNESWQQIAPFKSPSGLEFFIRPEPEDDDAADKVGVHYSGQTAALDTRGWTFQEGLLPKRQLVYWGNELAWKCNGRSICECGHVFSPGFRSYLRYSVGLPPEPNRPLQMPSASTDRQLSISDFDHIKLWRSLVEDYSRRSLTKPTDKLAALEGLAKRVLYIANQRGIREKYHAGLWESNLIDELCWDAVGGFTEDPPFHHHRLWNNAPTWTWSSLHGPVAWHTVPFVRQSGDVRGRKLCADARVEEVHCEPSYIMSPMGSVDGGYIILVTTIVPLTLTILDETLSEERWGSQRPLLAVVRGIGPDIADVILDVRHDVPTLHHDSPWSRCWLSPDLCTRQDCECRSQAVKGQFWGCRMRTLMDDEEYQHRMEQRHDGAEGKPFRNSQRPEMHFLLLEETASRESYKRVGLGMCDPKENTGPSSNQGQIEWPLFNGSTEERIKII